MNDTWLIIAIMLVVWLLYIGGANAEHPTDRANERSSGYPSAPREPHPRG